MLIHFILVIVTSIGLSILLTQKGNQWPAKYPRIQLQRLMHLVYWKWPGALYCTTCTTFWMAFLCQLLINAIYLLNNIAFSAGLCFFITWPLVGFAAAGIVFVIYQLFNSISSGKNVSVNLQVSHHDLQP